MAKWLVGEGKEKDIVISSRIRLARNLSDKKFPQFMSNEEGKKVIDMVNASVKQSKDSILQGFDFYDLNSVSPLNRIVFIENHLISPRLIERPQISGFWLKNDEKITIMINEEDHIRIQVLLPGLNMEKGWEICSEVDDEIEANLDYAFDEEFGYLTSCPTNVGTGLRASVMVHLPCFVITGNINTVLQAVNQVGLTVRGLYGEGTEAMGNIFQISNQVTMGDSEKEIIQKLNNVVMQIITKERDLRRALLDKRSIEIEDKVYRSLGILKNSRIISSKEAMKLLSNVRMGIVMGIIKDIDINVIDNLMIESQPASLQKHFKNELSTKDRDIKRAEAIRENIIG